MKPQFEKHKFSVVYGSEDYNNNFDRIFRKKVKNHKKAIREVEKDEKNQKYKQNK